MRAERWCWVVITRKPGQLRTYVNGRLCSDIKLESVKKDKKDDKPKAEEVDGDEGKDGAATVGPKPQLQEKFVLDPQFLALFASDGLTARPLYPPVACFRPHAVPRRARRILLYLAPQTTVFLSLLAALVLAPAFALVLLPHAETKLAAARLPALRGAAVSLGAHPD